MWIFMARPARPDAAQWAGRRALALIDALAWPALWIAAIASAPLDMGFFSWVFIGLAGFAAVLRARRAIWRNERYWFTTWQWGVPIAALIAVGFAIKLLA
jgi:hypothetical protein